MAHTANRSVPEQGNFAVLSPPSGPPCKRWIPPASTIRSIASNAWNGRWDE
jgi:hypothetical protein